MNAPTRAVSALADVILRAQQQGRQTPMGIAFAIDAAQMVMSPETAAAHERVRVERDRYRIAWGMARTRALSAGGAADRYAARARDGQEALQHMLFAVLGSQLARAAAQKETAEMRRWLTERTQTLVDSDAARERLLGRVRELEQLLAENRPADEDPIAYELTAEAGKVTRGDAGGITQADAEPTVEVFRAEYEHEITPIESYTTREVAREHCETEAEGSEPRPRDLFELEWRPDPDDERAEELWVVGTAPGDEERTGYSVTAVAIATEYDPEADR